MQIVMQIDGGQRHELESMIKDLEEENKYVIAFSLCGLLYCNDCGKLWSKFLHIKLNLTI